MRTRRRWMPAMLIAGLMMPHAALAQPAETDAPAVEPASKEPVVELVDAGRSPRRALRLAPTAGQTQTLTMHMGISMAMSMSGMDMPAQDLPATVMTIKTKVQEVKPDGDIVLGFEITDTDLVDTDASNAMVVDAMRDSLESIEGLKGTSTTSTRGITRDGSVKLPDSADDAMRESFSQVEDNFSRIGVPFPAEEIGVGAKWTVTTVLDSNGLKLKQIADCELISLKGNTVKIKSTIRQSAPPQSIDAPGIPPGAEVHLTSFAGKGTSVFTMMLDEMLPRTTESTVDIDMDLNITGTGMGDQAMSQSVHTELEAKGSEAVR